MIGSLYRHRRHWVLLVCVLLSLILISTQESSPSRWMQQYVSKFAGFVMSPFHWFVSQESLRDEIVALRKQRTILQQKNLQMKNLEQENERLRSILNFQRHYKIHLIPGQIVGISQSPKQDVLRLDVGAESGVLPGMAAISHQGVVGKIVSVTSQYSDVQLLSDPYFRISVMLEKSRIKGILKSTAFDRWVIDNIPPGTNIEKGELILTSGYGKIYPPNLRVGVVDEIMMNDVGRFVDVYVRPTAELRKLEEVFVLDWNETDEP